MKISRRMLTYLTIGGLPIFLIGGALAALEFNRVAGLCSKAKTPIMTRQEAIDAVRNMRGSTFPSDYSPLRRSKAFTGNSYEIGDGGWLIREWTEFPIIHGYSVDFEKNKPQAAIECEVYACGAVDDCHTLGASDF